MGKHVAAAVGAAVGEAVPFEDLDVTAFVVFGPLDVLGAAWKDLIMPLLVTAAVLNPVTHTRRIVPRAAMAMKLLRLLNKLLV